MIKNATVSDKVRAYAHIWVFWLRFIFVVDFHDKISVYVADYVLYDAVIWFVDFEIIHAKLVLILNSQIFSEHSKMSHDTVFINILYQI